MHDTIQDALKALYCSFGGSADAVRDENDINALLRAIASLNVGAKIEEGGGGASSLVITFTDGYNSDQTVAETEVAWAAGVPIFVEAPSNMGRRLPCIFVGPSVYDPSTKALEWDQLGVAMQATQYGDIWYIPGDE